VIGGFVAWGPAALWAAVLFLLSASPDVPGVTWLPWSDKVGHLGLYAALGVALAWGRTRSGALPHAVPLALGVAWALSDEWHQSFVPGRDASLGDLVADALGLLTGYLVSFLLLARRADSRGGFAAGAGR